MDNKTHPPPSHGEGVYATDGYPPSQNHQQAGYPPQKAGYPPQHAGYPPQQDGYPPQQDGYPPQHAGYPPQQAGYPPPGGYSGYYGQPGYQPGFQNMQQQQQTSNNIVVTQQPSSINQVVVGSYQDHMTSAILVTLCCFWPTGIVAIIRASEARSAMSRGDLVAASSHSQGAKTMVTISIVIGIISIIIVGIIIGVSVALRSSTYSGTRYING